MKSNTNKKLYFMQNYTWTKIAKESDKFLLSTFDTRTSGFTERCLTFSPSNVLHTLHASILCLSSDNASSEAEKTFIAHQTVFTIPTLLELPYLDLVRFHLVNQMHNLFVGNKARYASTD